MGNMNRLSRPIERYTRMDGREVIPVQHLDFHSPVPLRRYCHYRATQRDLLVPGTIFGAIVRYHWPEVEKSEFAQLDDKLRNRSTRVHLQGLYSGEHLDVNVPVSKFHPQGATETVNAPLMDMKVWVNPHRKVNIGTVAVAYLLSYEPASLHNVDHPALQKAMGITASGTHSTPYFSKVQEGGLYYVPPLPVSCSS